MTHLEQIGWITFIWYYIIWDQSVLHVHQTEIGHILNSVPSDLIPCNPEIPTFRQNQDIQLSSPLKGRVQDQILLKTGTDFKQIRICQKNKGIVSELALRVEVIHIPVVEDRKFLKGWWVSWKSHVLDEVWRAFKRLY